LTFILVAILYVEFLAPSTLAVLHTILEIADVVTSIFPLVLSESVRLAKLILSRIHVTVGKNVSSLTVFKTIGPLTFISVTVLPLVYAVSICLRLSPLTDV
jgi:hypothetical protein